MTMPSAMEVVKTFVIGPGDYADHLVMEHDDTLHKRSDRTHNLHELVDENCVVHIPASMPYGGDHVGPGGFQAMSDAMNATWRISGGLDNIFVELGEDQVLCFVQWTGESLHTGKTVPMRMAEFFRVDAGKIVEITIFYWDTAAVVDATGGVKTVIPERLETPTLRAPRLRDLTH
jgi:ketosteroid isomerase-like protein